MGGGSNGYELACRKDEVEGGHNIAFCEHVSRNKDLPGDEVMPSSNSTASADPCHNLSDGARQSKNAMMKARL